MREGEDRGKTEEDRRSRTERRQQRGKIEQWNRRDKEGTGGGQRGRKRGRIESLDCEKTDGEGRGGSKGGTEKEDRWERERCRGGCIVYITIFSALPHPDTPFAQG